MSEIMKETKLAPWTVEEVELLNDEQVAGKVHPYTCGQCRDNLGTGFYRNDDGSLRPWDDKIDKNSNINDNFSLSVYEHLNQRFVHRERILVATLNGWICPTCNYTQNWYLKFN